MNKKNLKLKKSRHKHKLSRTELFPKKAIKEDTETWMLDRMISFSIPDREERKKYVQALIDGLENEPIMEL